MERDGQASGKWVGGQASLAQECSQASSRAMFPTPTPLRGAPRKPGPCPWCHVSYRCCKVARVPLKDTSLPCCCHGHGGSGPDHIGLPYLSKRLCPYSASWAPAAALPADSGEHQPRAGGIRCHSGQNRAFESIRLGFKTILCSFSELYRPQLSLCIK